MPMLMRPSPLALEKISGFPSSWPSPIFIKIFSWVVSQAIGVLKPQKLSTNYSPNHSMVRPTTRTITSPCLRCLQSMRQRGLDMNISSGGSSEIQMEGIWQLCFCSCPSKEAWDSQYVCHHTQRSLVTLLNDL